MAIISHQYLFLGRFYEATFGMTPSSRPRPLNAVTVGDGVVGLNINPKRDGYVGGLDHFGMVVDNVDDVLKRMKSKHPGSNIVKRPSTRPFAAYSGNDPDGNVFDLAQKREDTMSDVYAQQATGGAVHSRYLNKFAIRTPNPAKVADFYADVFELVPVNKPSEKGACHLTDGRVTLSILPWSVDIFAGMSIKRPGPDHIGFHVESVDAVKADVEAVAGANNYFVPFRLGGSREADVRRDLFVRSATGKFQMADPDGTWIDVTDE